MGGFALWVNVPRACLFTHKADKNSQEFKSTHEDLIGHDKELKQLSLLQSMVVNEGPTPANSIKLMGIADPNDTKELAFNFSQINRAATPELWGQAASQKVKELAETREMQILLLLKDSELKSPDLKQKILDKMGGSEATIKRLLKTLKANKLITGGGRGVNATPYKITQKGQDRLNE